MKRPRIRNFDQLRDLSAMNGPGVVNPASPATGSNAKSPGLKTYFKSPEGKYKLQYEKTHTAGFGHQAYGKIVAQVTLAHLKEKPAQVLSQPASASGSGVTSGVRSMAARFLGGGNGGSKPTGTGCTMIGFGVFSSNNGSGKLNFDGKGTYLVFNVNDAIFLSDLNSEDKDPIKSVHFSNSNPVCHAYDPDAKDGHDLLIGLSTGDVYTASLRQQLQDVGKKLIGAHHYNKDGSVNNSRCTCVAWIPNGDGAFVVAHADGNAYVYEKNKDISADPSFLAVKDQTQFPVSHARNSKNPVARWHICQSSINGIAFSVDGVYFATVGRDGYLRVFDYKLEQLIFGGKSYYGALLCCAWSIDGNYILTGGEDDLVQVWSVVSLKVVAWGEGHNSWVSGVAFDPYWVAPDSDCVGENMVYRFGSVGQDGQLLLWEFELDELVVPVRCAPNGSPSLSSRHSSSHVGTLQPAPRIRHMPKLSPLVTHYVHMEPLSGVAFTQESILTICRDGHIKIWRRPEAPESQLSGTESSLNEKPALSIYKQ